jgi:glutaredoxin
MNIQLLVTKTDFNLPNIEKEFRHLGVEYNVEYIEDHPELVSMLNIRHSPNIIINGELAFQRQPSEDELKEYLLNH